MKKTLFALIALAVAATACNKADVIDMDKEVIAFADAFVDNATKAIDPSYGAGSVALTQFNVWGTVEGTNDGTTQHVPVFANTLVTGTVNGGNWQTQGVTQYWIPDAQYHFAAVVNGGEAANFTLVNGLPTAVSFTSADGQTDLLYAAEDQKALATGGNNPAVEMAFAHMLAKAVFKVTNTTAKGADNSVSNYYFKISDVKILNPMTSGTCTFAATPAWSGQTQATDATYTFGNVTDAAKTSTESIGTAAVEIHDADVKTSHRELMLIPKDYSTTKLQLSYTLQLYMEVDENAANDVLVQEEGKTASAAVNIQPGYAYSFNLNVGVGQKIEFSVTSQPTWGSPQGGDITVQ